MKSAVIYYSFSGNTRKAAELLREFLSGRGSVEMIELAALDESKSFLGQCRRAFAHVKGKISPAKLDLSGYDMVFFGTPVWAFGPAPAMNAYLEGVSGLQDKNAVLFATYGSGAGKGRCLDYMQEVLAKKGAKGFSRVYIQQLKVNDKEFVLSEFKKAVNF